MITPDITYFTRSLGKGKKDKEVNSKNKECNQLWEYGSIMISFNRVKGRLGMFIE